MTTHVALLRAVNLGKKGMIAMSDLREIVEKQGFAEVRTLLQTGNVLLQAKSVTSAAIEKQLEQATQQRFDYDVPIIVRTVSEWKKVVVENPFPREALDDPAHLVVFSLKKAPTVAAIKSLRGAHSGPEYFEARGRTLYVVYPKDIGNSKFTGALIERKLGVSGTGRNWNTALKIAAAL